MIRPSDREPFISFFSFFLSLSIYTCVCVCSLSSSPLRVCVRRLSSSATKNSLYSRDIKSTASLSFFSFLDFLFFSVFLSFFLSFLSGNVSERKRNFVNFSRPSWDGLMESLWEYIRERHRSVGSEREGLNLFLKCKVCVFFFSLSLCLLIMTDILASSSLSLSLFLLFFFFPHRRIYAA